MRTFVMLAILASACGCGGGGGGSPSPSSFAVATPTPTPTAPPGGPLTLSAGSVALTLIGASTTVTASEPSYAGTVTPDASACGGVVSIAPAAAAAPATFTLTARGAGTCTLAFGDAFGQRTSLAVGVTVTQGSIK